MSEENNKNKTAEEVKEKLFETADIGKEKVKKVASAINETINKNDFYTNTIKPLLDKIFAKVSPKFVGIGIVSLLVLIIGVNIIGKAGHNSKLDADYYVYQTQTEISRSQTNYNNTHYSDIASVIVFFEYKGEKILELFAFKKLNTSEGTNSYKSLLGWQVNNYLPIKYKVQNGNELYLLNEDGSVSENYWIIQDNMIITHDGKELIGMSETEFRRTTKIGPDCLKQDYSKKVKSGKMESVYELALKEMEKQEKEKAEETD